MHSPAGYDAPETVLAGGQALGRQRLKSDIEAVIKDLGFERVDPAAARRPSSETLAEQSVFREPQGKVDIRTGAPGHGSHLGQSKAAQEMIRHEAVLLSGTDIVACQQVGGGQKVKAAILLATEDYFVDVSSGREGSTGQPISESQPTYLGRDAACLSWLTGEHRVRVELIRGMGWSVGVLQVEQWRRAGREGGREARLKMMRDLLPSMGASSGI